VTRHGLTDRIKRDRQLRALFGDKGVFSTVPVPTESEAAIRGPGDLPPMTDRDRQIGERVALALMVDAQNKILRRGLGKLGVPPATLDKLKTLDDLPIEAALFLARSLSDTHHLYYVQVLALEADADYIRKNYLRPNLNENGTPKLDDHGTPMKAPNDENTVFWQRALNEIIEELGKAYDRIRQGTIDLMKMEQMARGEQGDNLTAPGKPSWGTKNVSPIHAAKK
jgi:hypothetical protein